jgi:alpha-tubulin suppressor-like RCC1 family protein
MCFTQLHFRFSAESPMRLRQLVSVVLVAVVAGCLDNTAPEAHGPSAGRQIIAPSGTLDQNIDALFGFFPKGLANAGRNRWGNVKAKYQAGLDKASQMEVAKKQLLELVQWVREKSPDMSPPDNESPSAAAARLVLYMSQYVYEGPATTPPPFIPGADATVGLVSPTEPATIVTPQERAGVAIDEGSVTTETIIVITENPTPFPDNCAGPLNTKLCQYPQFYHFSQFPHVRLEKPAKFAVCHVNSGTNRRPLADHDRFRLAHTKPENPADYTPGSTIADGIEILPLITETFSVCDDVEYALAEPHGLAGALTQLARHVGKMLTPKNAYAIDQGGGGMSFTFSDFNDVDPDGTPDDSLATMTTSADTAHAGDHVMVTYSIVNVGTATSPSVPATIRLTMPAIEGPPSTIDLTTVPVPAVVPGQTVTVSTEVVMPESAFSGTYTLSVVLGTDETFPDANLDNGTRQQPIVIDPAFLSLARTFSVGEASVCALASGGMYCWGENQFRELGTETPQVGSPFQAPQLQQGFVELARGVASQFYCGIDANRAAACWGRDGFGQLGRGQVVGSQGSSAPVAGGIAWAEINTNRLSACGVSLTGVGYCWGSNQRGEVGRAVVPIGTDPSSSTSTPGVVDGGFTWRSVVAGWLHACGITTAGDAYCWGDNSRGQLGVGSVDADPHQSPVAVAGGHKFIQLSLGPTHTCGITTDHKAYCWGENFTGQVGNGSAGDDVGIPTEVAGSHHFSFIAAGSDFGVGGDVAPPSAGGQAGSGHTCALAESGEAWCWGWNASGELGNGTTVDSPVPVSVSGSLRFTSIAAGGTETCGRNGSRIWCWGGNQFGQLGNGTVASVATPALVGAPFGPAGN